MREGLYWNSNCPVILVNSITNLALVAIENKILAVGA